MLAAGSGARMLAWWRVALAVEAVGTMAAALRLTVDYARAQAVRPGDRIVPGGSASSRRARRIGRGGPLAGARGRVPGAPDAAAELAAIHTCVAARRVCADTHQFSGAIGFAEEYDLHLWTMRLPAVVAEAAWLGATAGVETPSAAAAH